MDLIEPLDAAFLMSETREHPMHIGGLLLFEPAETGPDVVSNLYQQLLSYNRVRRTYRRRPALPGPLLGALRWFDNDDVDLEYHVRLSALPRPGRVRELLTLVSRLHGTLLDRHRPLWEFHLIEGLADGRFAIYSKTHHALVDGIRGTRQMTRMFSPDPAAPARPPYWAEREPTETIPAQVPALTPVHNTSGSRAAGLTRLVAPIPGILSTVTDIAGVAPGLAQLVSAGLRNVDTVLPFQAPRTIFNVALSGSRRYAAQSWSYDRMRAVATTHGATFNDVVLAMCAGALRRYLLDADALPSDSLVAGVPVALPVGRDQDGGNAVSMVLCRLATDVSDPHERLRRIRASMLAAKSSMAGRSALQISLLGLATATGPSAANLLPGYAGRGRPPYNVVISNVPGPRQPMYWNGARIVGWYPVSLPMENQALNITVLSYADNIEFGLIGCRRSIPSLQRLLDDLEESLRELEHPDPGSAEKIRSADRSG